jgi:hypothetical protein
MIAASYDDLDSHSFLPSPRRLYCFVDNQSFDDGAMFEIDALRPPFG